MTGATHVTCGYLVGITMCSMMPAVMPVNNALLIMPVATMLSATGSLLPDIDLGTSSMGKKHKIIAKLFKHRGATHSLVFPLILLYLSDIVSKLPGVVFSTFFFNLLSSVTLGWLVHIAADAMNKKGVPILWPISDSHFHILSVKTGTWQEKIFLAVCFVLMGVILIKQYLL